jgi:hypothetical protein
MNARILLVGVWSLLCGCAAARAPAATSASHTAPLQPEVAKAAYARGYDSVASACDYLQAAASNAVKKNAPVDPDVGRWQEACAEFGPADRSKPVPVSPQAQADPYPARTARGLLDDACARFEEARRHSKPATSLTTYLGLCAEQAGFNAKALRLFSEAQVLNRRVLDTLTREDYDRQIAAAIARVRKHVAWLVIAVEPEPRGLQVLLDNVEVPAGDLARAVPVEPGRHQVWARAHDHHDEKLTLTTIAEQHHTAKLELRAHNPYVKPAAKGVGAAGLAALGVAAYFGYRTLKLVSDSNHYCDEKNVCTHEGADLRDRALEAQARGFGFAAAGLVTVGGSAIVYYTW